jgi:hypothetical protein
MKKVIRISENDLVDLIKKTINEDKEEKMGGMLQGLLSTIFKQKDIDVLKGKKTDDDSSSKTIPTDFNAAVNKVIDNFEGGYYHPDMVKDGRLKGGGLGDSGETMMGMDRKHGASFAKTSAGEKFWGLIDNENARKNWKYNYMGGSLENQLRTLVGEMIKPEFDKLSNTYLDPEAREIVKNSPELTFHFIYATWNGSGWFQKFARKINEAVKNGEKNPDELVKIAIDSRKGSGNSFIAKSGNIMSKVFNV